MRRDLRNTQNSFGWVSILFHWISMPIVLFLLVEGIYMVTLTYYDTLYHTLPQWHKVVGVLLMVVTIMRFMWAVTNPLPVVLAGATWQRYTAHLVHYAMYAALLLLGMTGYLITTAEGKPIDLRASEQVPALIILSVERASLLGQAHQWIAYTLGALICLHAGAALFHHFYYHDNTLKRILKPETQPNSDH